MIVSISRRLLAYEFTIRTDDSPSEVQRTLEKFVQTDAGLPLFGMRLVGHMNGPLFDGRLVGHSALQAIVEGAVGLTNDGGSDVMFRVTYPRWFHAIWMAFGLFIVFLLFRDLAGFTVARAASVVWYLVIIAGLNVFPTWMTGSWLRQEIEVALATHAPIA